MLNKNLYISLLFCFVIFCNIVYGQKPNNEKLINHEGTYDDTKIEECHSTREFVTTLEFLKRNKKEFGINEKLAHQVADKVSAGCTGASSRFLKILHLLLKSSMDTSTSINIATRFALSTKEETNAFITIFKYAYLEAYLDLDLLTSSNLAIELSVDFKGNAKYAEKDFMDLASFCLSKKGVSLDKIKCLNLSRKVVFIGEKFSTSLSSSFIELYKFLTSKKWVQVITSDALKVSLDVIEFGPMAVTNFIQAYKYATSESGLSLNRSKAISFSKKMSQRSFRLKTP